MASSWGRKETLITPPTVPVYTFTAFGVALMCLCLLRMAESCVLHAHHATKLFHRVRPGCRWLGLSSDR